MIIVLGNTYKDTVTGFEGVATGRCKYISGCYQVLLSPKCIDVGTKLESHWFDVQRLEEIKNETITLDNSKTPGPDKAAPKK